MYNQTKKQATEAAKRCKARMRNPKLWRISVGENLGWFWCLESDEAAVTVWPSNSSKYHCMISEPGSCRMGSYKWHDKNSSYRDPQMAVDRGMNLVREFVGRMQDHMIQLDKELGI
jgi:hypothetical protein